MRFAKIVFTAAEATVAVPDLLLGVLFIAPFAKTPTTTSRARLTDA